MAQRKKGKVGGGRRWEDLDADCLANVFNKVGMESLILVVPFVCKSWYEASLNPLSWQHIIFPFFKPFASFVTNDDNGPKSFGDFYDKFIKEFGIDSSRFSITAFVKLIVDRSKGNAIVLGLPELCTEESLIYVSSATPLLKKLSFNDEFLFFKDSQTLPEVIGEWKLLESLDLMTSIATILNTCRRSRPHVDVISEQLKALLTTEIPGSINVLDRILVQVGTHCMKLEELRLDFIMFGETEASTVVDLLPNLQIPRASFCEIERNSIFTIMRGCKKLVEFHAKRCEGFEENDEEIIKLDKFKPEFCKRRRYSYKDGGCILEDITFYLKHEVFKMWNEE